MRDRLDELHVVDQVRHRQADRQPATGSGRPSRFHADEHHARGISARPRPSVSRFRVSVGQMTIDEHLVAQAETDGRHDKATRNE